MLILPLRYYIAHLLTVFGGLCILFFLSKMVRERRHPGSTLAWIFAIVVIPYVGIPLYLILGNRKLKRVAGVEQKHPRSSEEPLSAVITVLPDGVKGLEAIESLIKSAEHTLAVCTYVLGDDPIGEHLLALLTERARAGVSVYLMIDGVGSFWHPEDSRRELIEAGGHVQVFLPVFRFPFGGRANLRNHRKILIADGTRAIVGGMNLADNYLGDNKEVWKDLSFIIEGDAVADVVSVFEGDWAFAADEEQHIKLASERQSNTDQSSAIPVRIVPSGPDTEDDRLLETIVAALFRAKRSITIVTPYFVPDETLLRVLSIRVKQGVSVRLIIPKDSNHPLADFAREDYLKEVERAGVEICLYGKVMLHAKLLVLDEREIIAGSANMDIRSMMLNGQVMSEADNIHIRSGEVVRFVMTNRTMMYHPMHLHGHFFRVVNNYGDYSPLKHTVIVEPMQTTTIEFDASERGDWFFHCHLLYHMMSGMARLVHYEDFSPPPNVDQSKLLHDHPHFMGDISGMSNMAQGNVSLASARHILSTEWQLGWAHVDNYSWEAAPMYEYYVNRFWNVLIGADLEGDKDELETEHGVLGFRNLLPLNIATRHWIDSDLGYQVALHKDFELTPRLHLYTENEFDTETKWELRSGLMYQLSRDFSLQTQWHSDFSWGGGIQISF